MRLGKKVEQHILFVSFIILFLFCPTGSYAHGVRGQVALGGIVLAGEYSTGEAMRYARVDITAPGSSLPFQSGRTDRNGRFCFFPYTPGQWKIVISDEMGHRLEVKASVNAAMKLDSIQRNRGRILGNLPEYERILMGVSIIFWHSWIPVLVEREAFFAIIGVKRQGN